MVDFSLLQTPNFLATATGAFQAGQQQAQQRNRQNALAQYGQDPQGTRNALMQMGDIQTAGQLQDYETDQSQQQWRGQVQDRQKQEWQQEDADRMKAQVLQTAQGLRALPLEARAQAYQTQAVPLLQQLRVPQEAIDQVLSDGKLSDEEIDMFIQQYGGELSKLQGVNLGGGGYGTFNPNRSDPQAAFSVLREPDPAPDADLRRQLLEAQIAATHSLGGQRDASAAKARRPAATQSGTASHPVVSGGQVTRRLGPTLDPNDGW